MTDVGNQLLTQANAQGAGVVIDNLVISNNKPTVDLSKLDESFFSITIPINAKSSQGNTLQVESVLNNTNFSTDYPVNVVGITAHIDGESSSNLLAVAEADEPIVIPASADIQYTQYFDFSIINDKSANIIAEINPAGTVSNNVFNNTISSFSNALNSYATNSALSSVVNRIPASANLSGLATTSSVASQIASTESYANSVNVSTYQSAVNTAKSYIDSRLYDIQLGQYGLPQGTVILHDGDDLYNCIDPDTIYLIPAWTQVYHPVPYPDTGLANGVVYDNLQKSELFPYAIKTLPLQMQDGGGVMLNAKDLSGTNQYYANQKYADGHWGTWYVGTSVPLSTRW